MIGFLFVVLGLCFGSFITVIVDRLHKRKVGIIAGHSECPNCGKRLTAIDLVPVLSYLFLRGHCRYCQKSISIWYPITELTCALLFLGTYRHFGLTIELAFWLPMGMILLTIAVMDFRYQEIPDTLTLPTIAGVLITSGFWKYPLPLGPALIGAMIPMLLFGTQYLFSKGRWIGDGDIRLGAIMGLLLGWQLVLVALFISYIGGAIVGLAVLLQKKAELKTTLPFGVFLILGTLFTMTWGQRILDWYLGLLI